MSFRKIAVLSMLVVLLIASNIPASAAIVGGAGVSSVAASSITASSASFGAFGGFGWPFNWGFAPFGVGAWPFNWALGGGWGPFPFLSWNKFSPGFFGCCGGSFPFSPCFMGGCGMCQAVPFILGSPLGCSPVLGWDASPWAFGLQSCVRSLPLYFNAHGFGFPFTLGNYRIGLIPSCLPCGPAPIPACLPAGVPAVPAIGANAPLGGLAKGVAKAAVDQAIPFIIGSPLGCSPVLGWDASPWAFGLQSCVRSLPLYFNAHGFGFPFTLGNYRIGLIPSCLPCGPAPIPACLPAGVPAVPAIGANAPLAANAPIAK